MDRAVALAHDLGPAAVEALHNAVDRGRTIADGRVPEHGDLLEYLRSLPPEARDVEMSNDSDRSTRDVLVRRSDDFATLTRLLGPDLVDQLGRYEEIARASDDADLGERQELEGDMAISLLVTWREAVGRNTAFRGS